MGILGRLCILCAGLAATTAPNSITVTITVADTAPGEPATAEPADDAGQRFPGVHGLLQWRRDSPELGQPQRRELPGGMHARARLHVCDVLLEDYLVLLVQNLRPWHPRGPTTDMAPPVEIVLVRSQAVAVPRGAVGRDAQASV